MTGKLQVALRAATSSGYSVLIDRNIRQLNWKYIVSAELQTRQITVFHKVRFALHCNVLRPAEDNLNMRQDYGLIFCSFFFQALNFLQLLTLLPFSTTSFFHFSRSWTQAVQFLIFIWQMSCLILSSHLYLGLPCDFWSGVSN